MADQEGIIWLDDDECYQCRLAGERRCEECWLEDEIEFLDLED